MESNGILMDQIRTSKTVMMILSEQLNIWFKLDTLIKTTCLSKEVRMVELLWQQLPINDLIYLPQLLAVSQLLTCLDLTNSLLAPHGAKSMDVFQSKKVISISSWSIPLFILSRNKNTQQC
jgi:hypothetical protein